MLREANRPRVQHQAAQLNTALLTIVLKARSQLTMPSPWNRDGGRVGRPVVCGLGETVSDKGIA